MTELVELSLGDCGSNTIKSRVLLGLMTLVHNTSYLLSMSSSIVWNACTTLILGEQDGKIRLRARDPG